ncbi:superoxide dismutase [Cu-Zn] precursor [bacterium endosymbiont of Mortierella elongata FMR23-6]|nr:superoxide dismutase [Cu-Zn] precursor [bacterium endosymbiont of Mortierella elongata FMR23-6]
MLNAGCSTLFRPHEKRAHAVLLPTLGSNARGTVNFIERVDGMQVTYNLVGLPPNSDYSFLIYERGHCNAFSARDSGQVFDPSRWSGGSARPAGNMPNIRADANGGATGFVVVTELTLDGIRSVVGRSVVVLRNEDASLEKTRLACGVIRR